MSWAAVKLAELFDIRHGFAFKSEYFVSEGQYVVTTPGHFNIGGGFRSREGKENYYNGEFSKDFVLNQHDLVIAMTEQGEGLLGSTAIIPVDEKYLHNQRLGRVVNINNDRVCWNFLYYLLNTHGIRSKVASSASGTKVKHTAPSRILSIETVIPPLETQTRIASILSAYDDLIENNLKRIRLLEEAAQNIYREWFVLKKAEAKEERLPEGWEWSTYNELCRFVGGFAFKSSEYVTHGKYKIITIKNVGDRIFNDWNCDYIDEVPSKMNARCQIQEGDILLSLTGNIGRTCLAYGDDLLLNQRVAIIEPIDIDLKAYLYFHFADTACKVAMDNLANGVAQQNLSPVKLGNEKVLRPSAESLSRFNEFADKVMDQIVVLNKQNSFLTEARDILIPRLMNRTIEV